MHAGSGAARALTASSPKGFMVACMEPGTQPTPKRQISILAILIVAVATPATLALSYFHLTGDPTFQPLALSIERLAEAGQEGDRLTIRAVIRFDDTDADRIRAGDLAQSVHQAFYAKGLNARVMLQPDRMQAGPEVTYHVASSSFGPYTMGHAARGIQISVEALALNRTFRKELDDVDREHRW
jgi:hypothetical protein